MTRPLAGIFVCTILLTSLALIAARSRPLHTTSYEEIIRNYTFVADFSQKEPERQVTPELFWRYPMKVPKVDFTIQPKFEDLDKEFPATSGGGRPFAHINLGRIHFLREDFERARSTWLAARSVYGKGYEAHRRADYFLGYVFLRLGMKEYESRRSFENQTVKNHFSNASTFLSWSFVVKTDVRDPVVEYAMPKGLYNLAAIYWRYNRFSAAHTAAEKGLAFLRKTGRRDYRPQLRRIVAETFVRNRSYLEAVQQIDIALRQDHDPSQAAALFARVGDIYFDLNNYELAEDAYGMAARIDEEMRQINPAQLILRGESLFWLGRFSEAQKMMDYALRGASYRKQVSDLPADLEAYAALRIADAYLAQKKLQKAQLEYFQIARLFRKHEAGKIAAIRHACLDVQRSGDEIRKVGKLDPPKFPDFYRGKNVGHARTLFESAKDSRLPFPAQELAWACQVASYADVERTQAMVDRVRKFASLYPHSRFLKGLATPVKEAQAKRINTFIAAGENYKVISFYEKNRETLFPKPNPSLRLSLFTAYADAFQTKKASELWSSLPPRPQNDIDRLRRVVIAAEMSSQTGSSRWQRRERDLIADLSPHQWTLKASPLAMRYVSRVRNAGGADKHLDWIDNLSRHWAKESTTALCNLRFPVLSRMADLGLHAKIEKSLMSIFKTAFPALLKDDESCGLAFLDLEAKVFSPDQLALRYQERLDWPLRAGLQAPFWTVSEALYNSGRKEQAQRFWEHIVERAPPDSPYRQFAKARLDPARTELEDLWENPIR